MPATATLTQEAVILAQHIDNMPGRRGMTLGNLEHAQRVIDAGLQYGITEAQINSKARDIWIREGRINDQGASTFRHQEMALNELITAAEAAATLAAQAAANRQAAAPAAPPANATGAAPAGNAGAGQTGQGTGTTPANTQTQGGQPTQQTGPANQTAQGTNAGNGQRQAGGQQAPPATTTPAKPWYKSGWLKAGTALIAVVLIQQNCGDEKKPVDEAAKDPTAQVAKPARIPMPPLKETLGPVGDPIHKPRLQFTHDNETAKTIGNNAPTEQCAAAISQDADNNPLLVVSTGVVANLNDQDRDELVKQATLNARFGSCAPFPQGLQATNHKGFFVLPLAFAARVENMPDIRGGMKRAVEHPQEYLQGMHNYRKADENKPNEKGKVGIKTASLEYYGVAEDSTKPREDFRNLAWVAPGL